MDETLLTGREIREALEISRATLYRWMAAGLPSMGSGRQRQYDPEAILRWLDGTSEP
jgi:predicted DNA-binding transcriptional regulator AlpA